MLRRRAICSYAGPSHIKSHSSHLHVDIELYSHMSANLISKHIMVGLDTGKLCFGMEHYFSYVDPSRTTLLLGWSISYQSPFWLGSTWTSYASAWTNTSHMPGHLFKEKKKHLFDRLQHRQTTLRHGAILLISQFISYLSPFWSSETWSSHTSAWTNTCTFTCSYINMYEPLLGKDLYLSNVDSSHVTTYYDRTLHRQAECYSYTGPFLVKPIGTGFVRGKVNIFCLPLELQRFYQVYIFAWKDDSHMLTHFTLRPIKINLNLEKNLFFFSLSYYHFDGNIWFPDFDPS